MSEATGLSRGDRNRNSKLAALRECVPVSNAIAAIDLADDKQMLVVTDHDSRVLARRTFRRRAWQLGAALDWAAAQARRAGFGSVTVSCEPTGHRWRVVGQLAADRGLPFVCVQPLLVSWSRRQEDLTFDKTDDKDAVLIARLTAQLRCYRPEHVDATWGRLRHLGARRARLVVESTSQVQQMRDLLECVWPGVLEAAKHPFDSRTWCAAMTVVLQRADGDPSRLARLGPARFEAAVRRELPRWNCQKPRLSIVRGVFAALTDPAGVLAHRRGALERVTFLMGDRRATRTSLADTETRMLAVLDELELTELVTSIAGLSALGAATVLAETGDLNRFATGRALVKHAGLAPREKTSGTFTGRTKLTGQGRPGLRLAAWRAVWGAQRANPVYAARYQHLTTRENNKLTDGQAHAAMAATLLRQLHAVVTRRQRWNPDIAAGHREPAMAA
ncbi:MAG: IS110 family transposase [Actinomycetes bacterium]